jgi:hypothetical protein
MANILEWQWGNKIQHEIIQISDNRRIVKFYESNGGTPFYPQYLKSGLFGNGKWQDYNSGSSEGSVIFYSEDQARNFCSKF